MTFIKKGITFLDPYQTLSYVIYANSVLCVTSSHSGIWELTFLSVHIVYPKRVSVTVGKTVFNEQATKGIYFIYIEMTFAFREIYTPEEKTNIVIK